MHLVCGTAVDAEPPQEVFDELLKAGSVHVPDSEPRATPSEQWAALGAVLKAPGNDDFVSRVSEIMRDISDAVAVELFKEVRFCTFWLAALSLAWLGHHGCQNVLLVACCRTTDASIGRY